MCKKKAACAVLYRKKELKLSYNPPSLMETLPPENPAPKLKPKLPGIAQALAGFLVAMLAFNVLGTVANRIDLPTIWVTLIAEVFIIALVPVLFTLLGKYDFKATFSLKKISWGTLFLCVLIGGVTQFAVRFLGLLWQWFLQIFGALKLPSQAELAGTNFVSVLIFSLATLVLAPVCEEILCRGFVLSGFKNSRFITASIMGGVIFGLFHLYPYRFVDTALAGIVLTYLVLVTGSIFAGMAAHFGFNLLPTVIVWFTEPINQFLQQNGTRQRVGEMPASLDLELVVSTLTISLFCTGLVLLLVRSVIKRSLADNKGLFLNYNGFAVANRDDAETPPPDFYHSPGVPYTYADNGYVQNAPTDHQPAITRHPPPQTITKPGFLKSRPTVLTIIIFVLVLLTFAYSSYAEIQVRLVGG
jgi:uncharacterized protein